MVCLLMASLDSPITKYNRAREHVETLRGQLLPLSNLDSYAIAPDIDSKTGDQIRRFDHVPPMPGGIDVLIGEMLYNFRSSLDNLLWQLVLSEGNTPTNRSEFPIFKDSARYEAGKKGKLGGVSNAVATIIDRLQPCYSTGEMDYWKFLWDLQVLNNADKHRHLLLTRRSLGPTLRVSGQFGKHIPKGAYLDVPVETGAVFFRGEPNVDMKVEPRIDVFFSNAPPDISLPVQNTIDLIFGSVHEVFHRLRSHVK